MHIILHAIHLAQYVLNTIQIMQRHSNAACNHIYVIALG